MEYIHTYKYNSKLPKLSCACLLFVAARSRKPPKFDYLSFVMCILEMRFVHYGLTSITFEFLTNAVEQKCKTSVSKIAFVVKEFPMPLDLLVHDFDDSLFTRRATCQTKIAHVLDDYNLALARASRRFQLYQPNYARSCSQEGTYIHTYIHTYL